VNTYIDDHEPAGVHALDCRIWTTTRKPCNCQPTSPQIPWLTTAERLDLIDAHIDPFAEVAS
jgi:hypothetical protein